MTYQQAVTVRTLQLQGHHFSPGLVAQAIEVIQRARTPTRRLREKKKQKSGGLSINGEGHAPHTAS